MGMPEWWECQLALEPSLARSMYLSGQLSVHSHIKDFIPEWHLDTEANCQQADKAENPSLAVAPSTVLGRALTMWSFLKILLTVRYLNSSQLRPLTSFTPTSPCIGWCWDAHGHLEEVGDLLWKPLKEESQFFSQVSLQITIEWHCRKLGWELNVVETWFLPSRSFKPCLGWEGKQH